jgi:hypothetical protein
MSEKRTSKNIIETTLAERINVNPIKCRKFQDVVTKQHLFFFLFYLVLPIKASLIHI